MKLTNRAPDLSSLAPILAAALGLVLSVLAFAPGLQGADSLHQYCQGAVFSFSDMHPPFLSFLWGIFNRIVKGSLLYFAMQETMLWIALCLFARRLRMGHWAQVVFILAVGLQPAVRSQFSTTYKDTVMVAALLLSIALLPGESARFPRLGFLGALVFAFLAMASRHNAVLAFLPLAPSYVTRGLRLFFPEQKVFSTASGRVIASLLLTAMLVGLSAFTTALLVRVRSTYPAQQFMLHDLAAISIAENQLLVPESYFKKRSVTLDEVKAHFTPENLDPLMWSPLVGDPMINEGATAAQYSALKQAWFRGIAAHPLEYLKHRSQLFLSMLQLRPDVGCFLFITETYRDFCDPSKQGKNPSWAGYDLRWEGLYRWSSQSLYWVLNRLPFLFRVSFYFFCGLLLGAFLFLLKLPDRKLLLTLLSSAYLYMFSFFPFGPQCQFRYGLWLVVIVTIGIVYCLSVPLLKRDDRS